MAGRGFSAMKLLRLGLPYTELIWYKNGNSIIASFSLFDEFRIRIIPGESTRYVVSILRINQDFYTYVLSRSTNNIQSPEICDFILDTIAKVYPVIHEHTNARNTLNA